MLGLARHGLRLVLLSSARAGAGCVLPTIVARSLCACCFGRFREERPAHRQSGPGASSTAALWCVLGRSGFLTIGLFDPADPATGPERTLRMIELGTAVARLGADNPFRLAEDVATVDVLSSGRINPGPPSQRTFASRGVASSRQRLVWPGHLGAGRLPFEVSHAQAIYPEAQ